jgi:hypothetical protein
MPIVYEESVRSWIREKQSIDRFLEKDVDKRLYRAKMRRTLVGMVVTS